jgi:hypothetical protein
MHEVVSMGNDVLEITVKVPLDGAPIWPFNPGRDPGLRDRVGWVLWRISKMSGCLLGHVPQRLKLHVLLTRLKLVGEL